jgi:hypothetical protein
MRLAVMLAALMAPALIAGGAATAAFATETSVVTATSVVVSAPAEGAIYAPPPALASIAPAAVAPAHPAAAPVTKVASAMAAAPKVATSAAPSTAADRTAYLNAMYLSVVPAGERAALAGEYALGYNIPGINCGTGCTDYSNNTARSSFNATFFSESVTIQRNRIAHEAAHAYGFLHFNGYATPSWAGLGGWQAQFNQLDRSFVKTYDAEAFAACVAWKETGFNNQVNQISAPCTSDAATFAIAQIPQ